MEMFNLHRRDVHTFDDYMDLKKPGFGGPKSAEFYKDEKGNLINKNPKLAEHRRIVTRDPIFKNQVYDPTYKAMGGDLVHKQEHTKRENEMGGTNPYDYPDPYENMGIPTVEVGKILTDEPKVAIERTNEGTCYIDFATFILESADGSNSEEICEDCNECEEGCDCDKCKNKDSE